MKRLIYTFALIIIPIALGYYITSIALYYYNYGDLRFDYYVFKLMFDYYVVDLLDLSFSPIEPFVIFSIIWLFIVIIWNSGKIKKSIKNFNSNMEKFSIDFISVVGKGFKRFIIQNSKVLRGPSKAINNDIVEEKESINKKVNHMEKTNFINSITNGIRNLKFDKDSIIKIAAFIIFLAIIIPPWSASNSYGNTGPAGYYFILSNQPQIDWKFPSIDYGRLLLEIIAVMFISGFLIWYLNNKEKQKNLAKL